MERPREVPEGKLRHAWAGQESRGEQEGCSWRRATFLHQPLLLEQPAEDLCACPRDCVCLCMSVCLCLCVCTCDCVTWDSARWVCLPGFCVASLSACLYAVCGLCAPACVSLCTCLRLGLPVQVCVVCVCSLIALCLCVWMLICGSGVSCGLYLCGCGVWVVWCCVSLRLECAVFVYVHLGVCLWVSRVPTTGLCR